MRATWFFLLALITLVVACGTNSKSAQLETVEEPDEYGYLQVYQRRKTDFAREGWFRLINKEGVVIEAAQYVHDTLHGQRILFYDSGDTNIVETYRQGLFDGPYRVYREDGSLSIAGRFTNNVREGEWYAYYPNGQLREVVLFQDNLENGAFTEYHENGQLKTEGYYRDGDNEDGQLKKYNEDGKLVQRMNCVMGRCTTVWRADESDSNH